MKFPDNFRSSRAILQEIQVKITWCFSSNVAFKMFMAFIWKEKYRYGDTKPALNWTFPDLIPKFHDLWRRNSLTLFSDNSRFSRFYRSVCTRYQDHKFTVKRHKSERGWSKLWEWLRSYNASLIIQQRSSSKTRQKLSSVAEYDEPRHQQHWRSTLALLKTTYRVFQKQSIYKNCNSGPLVTLILRCFKRLILIAVRARNQKYDKSPSSSITVDALKEILLTVCHNSLPIKNYHTFLIRVSTGCIHETENCKVACNSIQIAFLPIYSIQVCVVKHRCFSETGQHFDQSNLVISGPISRCSSCMLILV